MTALPIRVKLLPGGRLPVKATTGSSGFDLFARIEQDGAVRPMAVGSGGVRQRDVLRAPVVRIPLGVAFEIPPGYEGQIRARSSLGAKGLVIPNGVGTIDSDYRGEVAALYMNLSGEDFVIRDGDRVAQIVFARVPDVRLEQVDALGESARGSGGFGSSGVREIVRAERLARIDALEGLPSALGSGPVARAPAVRAPVRDRVEQGFVPLTADVEQSNGGQICDMRIGPCSCGAWHHGEVPPSQPDLFRGDGDEGAPLGDPDE